MLQLSKGQTNKLFLSGLDKKVRSIIKECYEWEAMATDSLKKIAEELQKQINKTKEKKW